MSWDDFKEVALGVLQLPLSEFHKMTPRELILASKGYRERQNEEWLKIKTLSYFSLVSINGNKIKWSDVRMPNEKPKKPEIFAKARRI